MTRFVVLFRGINVGGHNKLPMKPLVSLLENNGFTNVTSYIQSGNIVLNSKEDPTITIMSLISQEFDLKPQIMTLTAEDFITIKNNNPYSNEEGKSVHCYICKEIPKINTEKIQQYQLSTEKTTLINNTFYLYAPDGIGRSKLVSNIETCLGVPTTGRNLNTINKIFSLLN